MKDCLTILSLRNLLNEPPRTAINSSTLIDSVFVSDACTVLDSGTMGVDEFISDHKATYIAIQISIKISTYGTIERFGIIRMLILRGLTH